MKFTTLCTYAKSAARGVGQVIFQPSWLSGIIMSLGILAGSLSIGGVGCEMAFVGGMASLILITAASMLCGAKGAKDGLLGFNAVLVGCAVFTFLTPSVEAWCLLVIGALVTWPIKRLLDYALKISSFTFPFVVATWAILLLAHHIGCQRLIMPSFGIPSHNDDMIVNIGVGLLKGLSEVFLADSWLAGILILSALLISNVKASIWAVVGSGIGMLMAWLCGCNHLDIYAGIWGFSPALTAVAVSTVLPSKKYAMPMTVFGVVFTFVIQYFLSDMLGLINLPVLTMPFCVATCVCAYILRVIQKNTQHL